MARFLCFKKRSPPQTSLPPQIPRAFSPPASPRRVGCHALARKSTQNCPDLDFLVHFCIQSISSAKIPALAVVRYMLVHITPALAFSHSITSARPPQFACFLLFVRISSTKDASLRKNAFSHATEQFRSTADVSTRTVALSPLLTNILLMSRSHAKTHHLFSFSPLACRQEHRSPHAITSCHIHKQFIFIHNLSKR